MGGKSVAIVQGTSLQLAKDGDTLQVLKMPGMFDLVNDKITPLQEKLERIMTSTDTLLIGLNNVLNTETQQHLKRSMAELEVLIRQLKNSSIQFNQLLSENKRISINLLKIWINSRLILQK